ncbi:MAG: AAA family ATPase [Bacteroidota bacterium]
MYISKVEIENFRSISKLAIEFPKDNLAGWHVVIGDNGSGKTSFVRAVAMALIGRSEIQALRIPLKSYIAKNSNSGSSGLELYKSQEYDLLNNGVDTGPIVVSTILMEKFEEDGHIFISNSHGHFRESKDFRYSEGMGGFSASFGPYRRFSGGNVEREKAFLNYPRLASHLSAFGEDVALTEALEWLQQLQYKNLEKDEKASKVLDGIKKFINEGDLLPHGAKIHKIGSEGVFFIDGNGLEIPVTELSDGYRSVLSMTFELIRQMVYVYDEQKVFAKIWEGKFIIDLPGVVLIDEVDAHLHPTWQVRIGEWFTKYFPKLQFIVTTHSPLVCRAAEKGTIWRLPSPGSDEEAKEITGIEKKRLVYGNVLDAFGTEVFGENVTRSREGHELLSEMAMLNVKSVRGAISEEEKSRLNELRAILPTES